MFRFILIFFIFLPISGCACLKTCLHEGKGGEEKTPQAVLKLEKAKYSDLAGWNNDKHSEVLEAFGKSCKIINKKPPNQNISPDNFNKKYKDLQNICKAYDALFEPDDITARIFFEHWFTPYLVSDNGNAQGLFTGYYESALNGSFIKSNKYKYPLHLRPDDLVMVYLGQFREDLKGHRIAGRVKDGVLIPYETREEIVKGKMQNSDKLEFVWLDNPIDPFFLHIQGSGRINLDNGDVIRVGYDGQNGHPYYAIGRELVKLGEIEKEKISLQTIRKWLEENPKRADTIMNSNKSYVFFRIIDRDGPVGAQNVTLTAGRSIAVDRTQIAYGLPIWLDAEPVINDKRIQRILIAQDTGGAIRGIVRGDVFWGYGKEAEFIAGHMKSKGKYWILLPK